MKRFLWFLAYVASLTIMVALGAAAGSLLLGDEPLVESFVDCKDLRGGLFTGTGEVSLSGNELRVQDSAGKFHEYQLNDSVCLIGDKATR